MFSRIVLRVYACAFAIALFGVAALPASAADSTLKVAFWNMRSGKGAAALPGYYAPFVDSTNCTDPSQPLNAWGTGTVQAHLTTALGDPSVIALGVAESWGSLCASPDRIRQALNWRSATAEQNGVALIARYGLAGPVQWQQLDTSTNAVPLDTMWVLRAPVCIDAGCTRSLPVYVAHWFGSGIDEPASLARQAHQTAAFLKATANGQAHVLVGDLNVFEGTATVCTQPPINTVLPYLRDAGYRDAWLTVRGGAEGYTGMVNRNGCGYPAGYPWKRIDYAWTLPDYAPLDIGRFGMVNPGDASPSDHYGLMVTLPNPFASQPAPAPVPSSGDGEIALYARRAVAILGTWAPINDATAAGGVRLVDPDAGRPKLLAPLASPGNYFELAFTPQAGRAYHLWIRGKAQNDFYANDSAYVQFSGSTSATGAPIYRIGSTSAATFSVEEASGAGESGWGWQDTSYGWGVPETPIYFDGTSQIIRVQSREDGVSIDQIVLSPVKYLTGAPGAAKNDTTILAEASGGASATAPTWTSLVNTTATGTTLQKVSGCATCSDAGAIANTAITSGGAVRFTVHSGHRLTVGLGTDTSMSTSYKAIEYGFSFSGAGTWEIREAGTYRSEGGSADGDVFTIAIRGSAVEYSRNGTVVYVSATPPPGALILDTSLQTIGASVTVIR